MEQPETKLSAAKRAARDERNRVRELLARERAEEEREVFRREAVKQVASGNFANIADTVAHPTPEWLQKGPVEKFTAKSPDNTSRSVRSVRRTVLPIVVKLWDAGKIDIKSASACMRYRDDFDISGLDGRYASNTYDINSSIRKTDNAGRLYQGDVEMMARARLHSAKSSIDKSHVAFFQAIVVEDMPIRKAARFVRCRNGKELDVFRSIASRLVEHYEAVGVDLMRHAEKSVA